MASDIQYVMSNKKRPKLCVDGYFYILDKMSKSGKQFWKCENHKIHCAARLHVDKGIVTKRVNEHSHGVVVGRANVLKKNNLIRDLASETVQTPREIIGTVSQLSDFEKSQMPKADSLRRTIQRTRQSFSAPRHPKDFKF